MNARSAAQIRRGVIAALKADMGTRPRLGRFAFLSECAYRTVRARAFTRNLRSKRDLERVAEWQSEWFDGPEPGYTDPDDARDVRLEAWEPIEGERA